MALTATLGGAGSVHKKGVEAWLAAQRASFVALQIGPSEKCALLLRGRVDAQCATFLSALLLRQDVSGRQLAPWSRASAAQVYTINQEALHACASLTSLQLSFEQWLPEVPELPLELLEQLPAALPRLFGSMTSLQSLDLRVLVFPVYFAVGLEAFVTSALTPLTRLYSLRLSWIYGGETVSVLPTCITVLADLRELKLRGIRRMKCAPGWADLPKLEVLHMSYCGVEGGADNAFPGISRLPSLTELVFEHMPTLTSWPSALWRLAPLRVLAHRVAEYYTSPRAALPAAWSLVKGLQDLDLEGQGYEAFPAVLLSLTTLTRLDLSGSCFTKLPEGCTSLVSLVALALGHPFRGEPGDLDVQALGCLSAFPQLTELRLDTCAVTLSADFAHAAHHLMFKRLELRSAFAAPGPSRAAVLAYGLMAKEQGRDFALLLRPESQDMRGVLQREPRREVHEFQAALEAGGLLRQDFMYV